VRGEEAICAMLSDVWTKSRLASRTTRTSMYAFADRPKERRASLSSVRDEQDRARAYSDTLRVTANERSTAA
jgi:hypothetical protein